MKISINIYIIVYIWIPDALQEFPVLSVKVIGGLEPTETFLTAFGYLWRKNPPEKQSDFFKK
jgi:hypothetical protein